MSELQAQSLCEYVYVKSSIFWDITPCSQLKVNRCLGGTYHLHLQGLKMSQARNQREAGWISMVCKALYPRRQNSS
jgi:hypothetical protein